MDFIYDFNKTRQRFLDVILQEGDGPTIIPTLAKKNHVWARWGKWMCPETLRNGNNFGWTKCDNYCLAAQGFMTTNLQTDAANKFYTDSTRSRPQPFGTSRGSWKTYRRRYLVTAKFDARTQNILKYINLNGLNQAWGWATDILMAVDIQNEPFLQARSLLQTPTGFDRLCGRAQTIKSVAPNLLASTGSIRDSNDRGHMAPILVKTYPNGCM